MILHWFLLIIFSFILYIALEGITQYINLQDWPKWVKTLVKSLVWLTAIVGVVFFAVIIAIFSASSDSRTKK